MKIALIADTFPPLRTSGAVQLRDLSRELCRQGHKVTVMLPCPNLNRRWQLDLVEGVQVLRLKAPETKDVGYIRRSFSELVMPFSMLYSLSASPLWSQRWDGVVWYSPSIFHGPFAFANMKKSRCKGYLIIRDIFPNWAVDTGLMRRGFVYQFFDMFARFQYSVADAIGVQSASNIGYLGQWCGVKPDKVEVLQNWLDKPVNLRCPIRLSDTKLAGRKVFVYAGNMGVAQGISILVDVAHQLRHRTDIGFVFVGRGSDMRRQESRTIDLRLDNVEFFDEIHPDEVPDLYAQCTVGMVMLNRRHKSHNIPGKFLTYMQSGLPVLACVNVGNDLASVIRNERVGQVSEVTEVSELLRLVEKILTQVESDIELSKRCRALFDREFSVDRAVNQIVSFFSGNGPFLYGKKFS
jgi:glycosyltransferase involved in cell wall biosynthesis